MTSEVIVRFGPTLEFPVRVDQPTERTQAIQWLEAEFLRLEAEPLRASGKVLTADKVLSVAVAAGASSFERNADWANSFACATAGALGRDVITVEVDSMSVSY